MLNKLITVTLFLGLLVSCTSENEPKNIRELQNSQQNVPRIIDELQKVNDSFAYSSVDVCSRGFLRGFAIFSADVIGAYEGGKIGGSIGGIVGSAFVGVGSAPGAGIGAAIGGAIGGIGSSYGMWCTTKGCGIIESTAIPIITNAYCTIKCELESDKTDDGNITIIKYLDIPVDVESLEEIGVIHNAALDRLINFGIMPFGNNPSDLDIDVVHNNWQLSSLETKVIQSEEFVAHYDNSMTAIFDGNYQFSITSDNNISDQVVKLYLETIEEMNNPDFESIVNFTNQYISIVSNSNDISELEKENLYIAFSVAVYSFQYWQENY